jgi:uncharacterized protein YlaI
MKDLKTWILFMCEVCEKIHDKDDRELVRKRLTKKTEMLFRILKEEIKESILHKIKK